jgi:toxin ParE1/3/4
MSYSVWLTDDAARDLADISDHVERRDGPRRADHVLDRVERAFSNLAESPHRGTYPRELLDLGIREYRQVFFKPYRIIYRVIEGNVYVLVIADGHRDMQALLQRRLLLA